MGGRLVARSSSALNLIPIRRQVDERMTYLIHGEQERDVDALDYRLSSGKGVREISTLLHLLHLQRFICSVMNRRDTLSLFEWLLTRRLLGCAFA